MFYSRFAFENIKYLSEIIYISGGERSGKSRYAQQLAEELSDKPVYLATARIWDEDFQNRVNNHKNDRDEKWTNLEEEKFLSQTNIAQRVVVVDCITLWLTNWFVDLDNDIDQCLKTCKEELLQLFNIDATLIIISNEIGMGVHASTKVGRKFTELQGWINQFIAQRSDQATFMVSGLPLKLK